MRRLHCVYMFCCCHFVPEQYTLSHMLYCTRLRVNKKVQVGNDQEKAQPEGNSHSNKVLIHREHIVNRLSSYFPISGHSYPNLTKH